MKTISAEFAYFLRGRARQNLKALILYCAFLLAMVLIYAVIFRTLMWHLEGREFSLIAGIYWAITVMTTLGFGDITFHSDPGYIFATVVTVSGVLFLLIILPFGMISLFLAPWIEHRLKYRLNEELPNDTSGHVVIFGVDGTTQLFMSRLKSRQVPFVLVTSNHEEAVSIEEKGFLVFHGSAADSDTLLATRVGSARYVVANMSDQENVTLCLSIRSKYNTPIAAFVRDPDHRNLMRQAGANQVIALHKSLGRYLAIRSTTCGALAHVLDSFGELLIAEIPVHGTPFSGEILGNTDLRQRTGLAVIGIWERGSFSVPTPDVVLNDDALLVLAGTREQLEKLEAITGEQSSEDLVFIIGHGRIGCAAARFLERRPVPYILIDRAENPACTEHIPIYGDATVRRVLDNAGIERAKGMIVTTNDDNTNIFLTLAVRQMLPHVRLVARANCEESVEPLYLAGADFVVSSASLGANILFNVLESKATAFLTEGINVFRRPLPKDMVDRTIAESRLRSRTGCSVVALDVGSEKLQVSPSPETVLPEGATLLLIGTPEQESAFDEAILAD